MKVVHIGAGEGAREECVTDGLDGGLQSIDPSLIRQIRVLFDGRGSGQLAMTVVDHLGRLGDQYLAVDLQQHDFLNQIVSAALSGDAVHPGLDVAHALPELLLGGDDDEGARTLLVLVYDVSAMAAILASWERPLTIEPSPGSVVAYNSEEQETHHFSMPPQQDDARHP